MHQPAERERERETERELRLMNIGINHLTDGWILSISAILAANVAAAGSWGHCSI